MGTWQSRGQTGTGMGDDLFFLHARANLLGENLLKEKVGSGSEDHGEWGTSTSLS